MIRNLLIPNLKNIKYNVFVNNFQTTEFSVINKSLKLCLFALANIQFCTVTTTFT